MPEWIMPLAVMVLTWAMTRADLRKYRKKPVAIYRAAKRFFIIRSSLISVLVWAAYFFFKITHLG